MKVLLAEDEIRIAEQLRKGLEREGYVLSVAHDGQAAMDLIRSMEYDLLVLDWMLPDRDGIEVLRDLRTRGLATPVLMLTARDTLNDRVVGLDSGADDYLSKPFAFAELLARCRALLRRPSFSPGGVLVCNDLQLDTRARVAVRSGQKIPLTPREVDVLEYLMRNQGQTVTREMLERDVWKQPQRVTSLDNVIDVQIMRLRKKVDPDGMERLIHTIRGVGYQMGGKPD